MENEQIEIDDKIRNLVEILNIAGFPTTGSCEGHIDRDSPAPWVKIGTEDNLENGKLRIRMDKLLAEFYRDHSVAQDIKMKIEDANFGFYLHNGGEFYGKWREIVKEMAAQIEKGMRVSEILISDAEKNYRAENLPLYQKEIMGFSHFLRKTTKK